MKGTEAFARKWLKGALLCVCENEVSEWDSNIKA